MALWRLRATVDDRPGFLAVLTASLALKSVNILSVQVHGTEAGAVDDFLVDAPDDLTQQEILDAVVKGRGRDPWIRRTDAHHLVDPPTEILGAAVRIIKDPGYLTDALADILLAVTVRPVPADAAVRPGFTASRMQIPDPRGGLLLIERFAPAFTPAEYARARALVDVARTVLGVRAPAPPDEEDDEPDAGGSPAAAASPPIAPAGSPPVAPVASPAIVPPASFVVPPPSVPFPEPAPSEPA